MKTIIALALVLVGMVVHAQGSNVFQTEKGAIKGYDAVAYFTSSAAVKGLTTLSYEWNGATWYFSNNENLEAFKSSPQEYAPQYGGYCAYAMSLGEFVEINPLSWTIVDGKLYLNYSRRVQKKWEADRNNFIAQANKQWANR